MSTKHLLILSKEINKGKLESVTPGLTIKAKNIMNTYFLSNTIILTTQAKLRQCSVCFTCFEKTIDAVIVDIALYQQQYNIIVF